jgi:tetratricopeptide (TPR) repeat protein
VRRLKGHEGYCVSLDFSRDGTLLASGSRDGTAILWSTATWEPTRTLQNPEKESIYKRPGHRGMVEGVAFSPDGQTLALASREGTLQLWEVATGTLLEALKGHSGSVQAVAFSPDGRTLASGGADQTIRLWNVPTRRELMQLDPGGTELGSVLTLAFSPDGKQLVTGGEHATTSFWSAAPVVWNDPDRAAERLRLLLKSSADFQSRIRMSSENLRLHEALAKLDAQDVRVRAALAATRANWQAARRAWPEAAAQFDRLLAADPATPEGWLRTPGLLRVATALVHRDRPDAAAKLLQGGEQRRAEDGLPAVAKDEEGKYVDEATGDLLFPLLAEVEKRLAEDPRDVGLLELRAELAGQESDFAGQAAHYTDAIKALAEEPAPAVAARLPSLYRRRGDASVRLQSWSDAVDDYSRLITPQTTDAPLLSQRARAQEALKNWDAAAADWLRVAGGSPQGAKRLSEFAQRLAAGGQSPSADAARAKVSGWFEERLAKDKDPASSASAAAELAALLLSAGSDRPDPDRNRKRFTAMRLSDPRAKLAAGYALNRRNEEALQYFRKALESADGYQARKPVVEVAAMFDDLVPDLIKGQPDEPQFQLALARHSVVRGRQRLALKQPAQAQAELEKSRELYTRLLAKYPEPRWTVLTPTDVKSAGGATLTRLDDGSILAGGTNPEKDTYTFVARTDLPRVTAFRLEAMAHPSLPRGGPGRVDWGNFALSEIALKAGPLSGAGEAAALKIVNPVADFEQTGYPVAASLDGNPGTAWSIDPQVGGNHTAVYQIESSPQSAFSGGARLTFTLDFQFNLRHALGRFRLSVTGEPTTSQAAQVRMDLKAHELVEVHVALAEAHAQQGHTDEAARDCERAIAAYRQALADQPADGYAAYMAMRLAVAYQAAGRTREALPHLASQSAANPQNTILALQVAAFQAWFGQEKELASTRQRALAAAKSTNDASTADRTAKACCLVPSKDKPQLETVMALARQAVQQGKGSPLFPYFQMALGMAEYRSGHFAEADAALLGSATSGKDNYHVAGTSAFFRAMSLFQQGKKDEARQLALAAAAKMKPLPRDENNPLAGGANADDLILWLAYREAKALIQFDPTPPPKAENDKK